MYWRIGSLPRSLNTDVLWNSIKRIITERKIDTKQDFDLDGIAGTIEKKLNETKDREGK